MQQLSFGFCEKDKDHLILQFPASIKKQLIQRMSVAILKITIKEGKQNNEQLTNECEDNSQSSES